MSRLPRILPLLGIAAGGVLALNALSGINGAPDLFSGARAFAQGVTSQAGGQPAGTAPAADPKAAPGKPAEGASAAAAPAKPLVCAPTAAELAKEAGLSPAELQHPAGPPGGSRGQARRQGEDAERDQVGHPGAAQGR
jgi:hypothetical protein